MEFWFGFEWMVDIWNFIVIDVGIGIGDVVGMIIVCVLALVFVDAMD